MPIKCTNCEHYACIKRSTNRLPYCKDCFSQEFESEVYYHISKYKIFQPGDVLGIGASGGKDSAVLTHLMTTLNARYNLKLNLQLISVDEGIKGYRDDSLETVNNWRDKYQLPLTVYSYKDLYGHTMDEIVSVIGLRNNCGYCGVFRRQAMDRAAMNLSCNYMLTGHNADDTAETILMNLFRGDAWKVKRCTEWYSGEYEDDEGGGCGGGSKVVNFNELKFNGRGGNGMDEYDEGDGGKDERNEKIEMNKMTVPKARPMKYCYEKEIVMYAKFNKLEYFATECTHFNMAFRSHIRNYVKKLEKLNGSYIINLIKSIEQLDIVMEPPSSSVNLQLIGKEGAKTKTAVRCESCGMVSSNRFCKACLMKQELDQLLLGKKGEEGKRKRN